MADRPKSIDEGVKPIHDGYKYPMVETKPVPRESLIDKVKRVVTSATVSASSNLPQRTASDAAAMADRKDQAEKLKGQQ